VVESYCLLLEQEGDGVACATALSMMTNMLAKMFLLLVVAKFVGNSVSPHRKRFSLSTAAVALADKILHPLSFFKPQSCP